MQPLRKKVKVAHSGERCHTSHVPSTHTHRDTPHVSPSQITEFRACQRKWAFKKIARLVEPPNRYADRGTRVHKVLEDYTLLARMPDLETSYGRIAFPALKHIPPPQSPNVTAEREVVWQITPDVEVVLIKDLEEFRDGVSWIRDYKTTSNLAFAKSAEDLRLKDPQAILCAGHSYFALGAYRVHETWLYLTANAPHQCHPVEVETSRDEVGMLLAGLVETSRLMLKLRRDEVEPLSLPASTDHCSAFGGCPFKAQCQITQEQEFLSKMSESGLDAASAAFLAQLNQNQTPQAPAQPPAVNWPPPSVVQPPAPQGLGAPQPPPIQTSPFPQVAQASVLPWLSQSAPQAPAPPAPTVETPIPPGPAFPQGGTVIQPADETPTQVETPKAKRQRKVKEQEPEHPATVPAPPAETSEDPRTAVFYGLLQALAMNPGHAAQPAVDLVDRAYALLTAGEKALGS